MGKNVRLRTMAAKGLEPMLSNRFAKCALVFQIILIALFFALTDYEDSLEAHNDAFLGKDVTKYYGVYQDVHVMIFIGFGFLMTFLAKYGFSAVGLNFFLAALSIQWGMLLVGLFHQADTGHSGTIKLDIKMLIEGDFAAGAVLITFGALLGKTSPLQLLIILFFELIVYNLNFFIGSYKFQAVDMGGSIFVHSFGAYFGLGAAWIMGRKNAAEIKDHKSNTSSKNSDTFAMIGTIFLWMFWPSFNGALADQTSQHRVIVNTVLSLCGSCVGTFLFSQLFRRGKLSMVDIQNATLAGGVAVGSAADLVIRPGAALLIGAISSFISVSGYTRIQPFLERKFKLYDTCGVHNLHGMPGLLGGISGAITAASVGGTVYGHNIGTVYPAMANTSAGGLGRTAGEQATFQILALIVCIFLAFFGGILTGCIAQMEMFEPVSPKKYFSDAPQWDEVSDSDGEDASAANLASVAPTASAPSEDV